MSRSVFRVPVFRVPHSFPMPTQITPDLACLRAISARAAGHNNILYIDRCPMYNFIATG